ncbi:hypothetical protein PO124_02545 [Bacillus licheniformis]|nr:hypothetical protein [Bacillus licheniformis]
MKSFISPRISMSSPSNAGELSRERIQVGIKRRPRNRNDDEQTNLTGMTANTKTCLKR